MSSTPKLLIVDDLKENLIALEALIRQDDRAIYMAGSGDEALSLMLEHDFALAILDVQMPGMSGLELAELMRGAARTRHIPIVLVSAAGRDMNYAFAGYETGAVDFLYKPLDPQAVRSKVNVFVNMYRQRKELEALLQQLQCTQAELERSIRMRDDFVSMVSHELRTPLNTLLLQAQLRRRMASGASLDPSRLAAMVERDEQQIRNMVRLVGDMQDISRLRRGMLAIAPAPADLAVLVRRVVETYTEQAAAAGSAITLAAPPTLPGVWDEFRIEQAVVNLVTNAIRYGGGKPIEVELKQEGDEALVQVRDHGMGINAKDQARVFEQFERAVDKTIPGLGLGLYITKQIVEAHGGRIDVRSVVGEGAAFRIRLPLESRA